MESDLNMMKTPPFTTITNLQTTALNSFVTTIRNNEAQRHDDSVWTIMWYRGVVKEEDKNVCADIFDIFSVFTPQQETFQWQKEDVDMIKLNLDSVGGERGSGMVHFLEINFQGYNKR